MTHDRLVCKINRTISQSLGNSLVYFSKIGNNFRTHPATHPSIIPSLQLRFTHSGVVKYSACDDIFQSDYDGAGIKALIKTQKEEGEIRSPHFHLLVDRQENVVYRKWRFWRRDQSSCMRDMKVRYSLAQVLILKIKGLILSLFLRRPLQMPKPRSWRFLSIMFNIHLKKQISRDGDCKAVYSDIKSHYF